MERRMMCASSIVLCATSWAAATTKSLTLRPCISAARLAKAGRLEGTWTAQPDPQTTIILSFLDRGRFTWKVTEKGVDRLIEGKLISGNGLLTLAENNGAPIVGNIGWSDETHFTFKVPGAGPDDQGLSFTRSH
jgi:hypothetical protein